MKMTCGLFWGVIILIFGAGIILNAVFHIHLPMFKIMFGALFIYVGIKIIFGGGWGSLFQYEPRNPDVLFGERTYHAAQGVQKEYNTIFGKSVLDLSALTLEQVTAPVEVNAIFGGVEIILNRDIPVRIQAETAFGVVQMPENAANGFGVASYQSPNLKEGEKYLRMKVTSVFAGTQVRFK